MATSGPMTYLVMAEQFLSVAPTPAFAQGRGTESTLIGYLPYCPGTRWDRQQTQTLALRCSVTRAVSFSASSAVGARPVFDHRIGPTAGTVTRRPDVSRTHRQVQPMGVVRLR